MCEEKEKILNLIEKEVTDIEEELIRDRRHLHMHPEVSYDTGETEKYVRTRLEALGIEMPPAKMGVFGLIPGRDHSKMVMLRADMDALPIQEENEVPYCSTVPGKMHACGHDAHTSMLLAASKILKKHSGLLPFDLLLMFQPAEEGPAPGGCKFMVEDIAEKGWLDKMVAGYAQHVFNDSPTGTVSYKYGSLAASTDEFYIDIKGKGGHAGFPQECIDALSVGAKVVGAIETFISRRMDPFDQVICSIGRFHAGNAINVVAEECEIAGTIRCQRNALREHIIENLTRIVEGTCNAFGAEYKIRINRGLTVLENNDRVIDYIRKIAPDVVGEPNVLITPHAMMGAEDFCFATAAMPAAMTWLGSWKEGLSRTNHHPKFNIDEACMKYGVKMFCHFALRCAEL